MTTRSVAWSEGVGKLGSNVIDFNAYRQRRPQPQLSLASWTMAAVPAVVMPALLVPPVMFPVAWFGFFMVAPQVAQALPSERRN